MSVPSRVLWRVILSLALLTSGPVLAAGFTCATPAGSGDKEGLDEPDEAVVRGLEATLSGKDMQAWLKQLVGRYTHEGYVDLCGNGHAEDRRPVTGRADCIAAGLMPNVHCRVNATWTPAYKENGAPVLGGVSNLAPAEYVFSMEIPTSAFNVGKAANGWGLVFVQLDNKGNGEWASGVLVGDTFIAREPCVDISGNCHKKTRITAKPDGDISMQTEIVIDRKRVLRQSFLLRRKPDSQPGERPAGSAP